MKPLDSTYELGQRGPWCKVRCRQIHHTLVPLLAALWECGGVDCVITAQPHTPTFYLQNTQTHTYAQTTHS